MALEHVAAGCQFAAQFAEVVDLAVEHHLDAAPGTADRLVATGHVDDGQAAHADGGPVILEGALIVGATVHDAGAHGLQRLRFGQGAAIEGDQSGNATHGQCIRWEESGEENGPGIPASATSSGSLGPSRAVSVQASPS